MSQFHKPRLSDAIILALLCIRSTFASPVLNAAERSSASIIGASEPVNIIDSEDLYPDIDFPITDSTTTDDGTTVLTTYNVPGEPVQKRDSDPVAAASEPVYVIPEKEIPPGEDLLDISSTTIDDGTTVTTTYHIPRDIVRKRNSTSIESTSEPVNMIPTNDLPPGQTASGGSSSTSNDGTTLTTEYTPRKLLSQNNSDTTSSVNLLSMKNITLAGPALDKGLNCDGSLVMCVGANQEGVMHTLRDYMYAIPKGYRYYTGQNIACMKHKAYPYPINWGFFCAFMQGNIPAEGVDGTMIQLKMQQMIEHHCLGCGSVPFSPDNDPNTLGILTVNYVRQSECEGLCYYVPPGISASAAHVPQGMTLAS